MDRVLGFTMSGLITVAMIASVVLLISGLPADAETPSELLFSAGTLWSTNILVFSLWYWRLDAGRPASPRFQVRTSGRCLPVPADDTSTRNKETSRPHGWSPNFVDYLFLAFNTSTAFSPTDVPVLERWAKVLMMVQSSISLTVLALLAARAVNIL